MNTNNIAALIVTYNPNVQVLKLNLMKVLQQVNYCLVVDNGSKNVQEVKKVVLETGAHILDLGKNYGIAAAQNKGFEKLSSLFKYNWVLTLDQDSEIPSNMIDSYIASKKMNSQTGIITCAYTDNAWSEQQKKNFLNNKEKVEKKNFSISSGNLVNVSAWKRVGGFDEFLFIDMVDYDFDAKLILTGYENWQVNSVIMSHKIGRVIHHPLLEKILFLSDAGRVSDHIAFRQYYIYRNDIIFYKRYPMLFKRKFITAKAFFATRRILLFPHKYLKLISAWKGIYVGKKYNPDVDNKFQSFMQTVSKYKE